MTATRRLAAILVADVVSYSRLMEADEAGTLAALKERRKTILEPVVKAHGGRIVKLMGDGVLVEFASAVKAVEAALQLQEKFAAANQDVDKKRHILLRIGINLGDVIGEGSDIYGDGVNIAARLEALAEPGGICVSRSVYEQVARKVATTFADLGEQQLKNIEAPVRAFAVDIGPYSASNDAPLAHDKPTIAVLPFVNIGGNPDQQYFTDGFTEDIITELSRWREISVKSRNATARYGPGPVEIARVARELAVEYVLEGSLRRIGSRIRTTVQLVNAVTGDHVWAERFDRDAEEIFAVQDEVIRTIVATMAGRIRSAELDSNRRRPPERLAAYECVLRGRALPWGDRDADRQARQLYERAIELDPRYALAHALLALSIFAEWTADPAAGADILERAWEVATKAVSLDPGEDMAHDTLGYIEMFRRNYEVAESHIRRALAINPSDPEHIAGLGSVLSHGGAVEEGLRELRRAQLVDPYFEPVWYWYILSEACFGARQYEAAIAAGNRVVTKAPRLLARLAACHAELGQTTLAKQLTSLALNAQPDITIAYLAERSPYRHKSDLDHFTNALRKAGLPE